jgi:hypothetical protein
MGPAKRISAISRVTDSGFVLPWLAHRPIGQQDDVLAICTAYIPVLAALFHYGAFQLLWQHGGLIQAGPRLRDGSTSMQVQGLDIQALQAALVRARLHARGVLLQYTDPLLLRAQPLSGLRHWCGPRLLVCGDLHHGERRWTRSRLIWRPSPMTPCCSASIRRCFPPCASG